MESFYWYFFGAMMGSIMTSLAYYMAGKFLPNIEITIQGKEVPPTKL